MNTTNYPRFTAVVSWMFETPAGIIVGCILFTVLDNLDVLVALFK
jgi:hypothetical protein